MNQNPSTERLFSFEFLVLCLIIIIAFCNISVFYGFYHYLGVIGIPVIWRGLLVGLEPMTAFVLRLAVLPWLHLRNSYSIGMASLVLSIVVSCAYLWVTTVEAMIFLRIIHGTVFVFLTSAAISLVVCFIPEKKSGQGFSTLSIATVIPYALMPPLFEYFLPFVRSEADIYAASSFFSVLGILLMIGVRRRINKAAQRMNSVLMRRPSMAEIRKNFQQRSVALLLVAFLFIYLAHATFFYFLKDLTLETGAGNVGAFFTVSMVMMIFVRISGAVVIDKLNKLRLTMFMLAVLILCFAALPNISTNLFYYLLAVVYGGAMGIALPVFSALVFSASAPALRGLNANMTMFAIDAAYFMTPYLGGMLITLGSDFGALFYMAAGFTFFCLLLIITLRYWEKGGYSGESGR